MLQFNTPNGLYTIRECDGPQNGAVKLLWSKLKEEGLLKGHMRHVIDHHAVEDLIGVLNGDFATLASLFALLNVPDSTIARILSAVSTGHRKPARLMTVACTDGTDLGHVARLRRRFQYIDDFVEEFPDASLIRVPFTNNELCQSMMPSLLAPGKLSECYKCLLYLNPKSNLYPLSLDQKGMTLELAVDFASRLTEEERKSLMAYGARRGFFVPTTEGPGILGLVDSVRDRVTLMRSLFPNHPSFCYIGTRKLEKDESRVLLMWDFSEDSKNLLFDETHVIEVLRDAAVNLHTFCETEDEVLRVARLLVPDFACMKSVTPLSIPYDVDCSTEDKSWLTQLKIGLEAFMASSSQKGLVLTLMDELNLALEN